MKCKNFKSHDEWDCRLITHDFSLPHTQMLDELKTKNSFLNSEKDELNALILEQAKELSGAERVTLYHHRYQ